MRFLACALLVIATTHAEKVCEPGKRFKEYCNSCECGPDGRAAKCTLMACDLNVWNKDGSLKLPNEIAKNPLLREARDTGIRCEPGKEFMDYCNRCFCSNDGKLAACTDMACDHNVWNKDGSLKFPNEIAKNPLLREARDTGIRCEPGQKFNDYCNKCTCGIDGRSAACTKMACDLNVWNKDGSLKLPNEITHNPLLREVRDTGIRCEPGQKFNDYCNKCTCGIDGRSAACTKMACDLNVWNKDGSLKLPNEIAHNPLLREARDTGIRCEPGKEFMDYCNRCFCSNDGKLAACTDMACDHNVWKKDGSLKFPNEIAKNPLLRETRDTGIRCEPGQKFNDYCNKCTCGIDGRSAACTKMACDLNVWNKDGSLKLPNEIAHNPLLREARDTGIRCEPGQKFNDYCNKCTCGIDGRSAACTKMACDLNVWNKDGSLKLPNEIAHNPLLREARDTGIRCEPGQKFNDYCNKCTCGINGRSAACTKMACDFNVWNKDGSLKLPNEIAHNPLLREVRDTGIRCEPGQKFNDYCNKCTCGIDGRSAACTKMACDLNVWNKDGSLKLPNEIAHNPLLRGARDTGIRCEPGQKFNDYCNKCTCGIDGRSAACTKMACDLNVWNKDGSLKLPNEIAHNPLLREVRDTGIRCEPGQKFNDYCNKCSCGRDGRSAACTMMACDLNVWNKDGSLKLLNEIAHNPLLREARDTGIRCEPGQKFNDYCNKCTCGIDGRSAACTKMACDLNVWNKDGSLKLPNEIAHNPLLREARDTGIRCEPGQKFNDYCNKCTCGSDGRSAACTKMACDHNVWNKDGSLKLQNEFLCQPGKFFMDDCNACTCGGDGKSRGCTLMLCPPRKDGRVPASQVCEPRAHFNIGCNQCVCSEDGLRIACTQMAC